MVFYFESNHYNKNYSTVIDWFICVGSFTILPFQKPTYIIYSTVTDLEDLTQTPYLIFTFHCKIDKKGNVIDSEYGDFNIVFMMRR